MIAIRAARLFDGMNLLDNRTVVVDGIRAAVRERAARGVDVVKVMASGGGLTAGSQLHESQYGRAELAAAVDEAHRLGLPIAAHAHAAGSVADAVAVGFDTIEHC